MVPTMKPLHQCRDEDLARLASEAAGWHKRADRERIEAEMWLRQVTILREIAENTTPPPYTRPSPSLMDKSTEAVNNLGVAVFTVGAAFLIASVTLRAGLQAELWSFFITVLGLVMVALRVFHVTSLRQPRHSKPGVTNGSKPR